jgi:hypothetical protein
MEDIKAVVNDNGPSLLRISYKDGLAKRAPNPYLKALWHTLLKNPKTHSPKVVGGGSNMLRHPENGMRITARTEKATLPRPNRSIPESAKKSY